MKIQILNKNEYEAKFLIEGITPAFANELRRIMLTEVPTMAIEWVDFKKNDSALPDELIANRLGQVPLTFDKKAYNLPEDCKCEGKGCSRCQTELVLKKKGPAVIYSGDLKSKDKSVVPLFDKIPIVELFEDQELQFEATAQLGVGRKHAKWQAANASYKNVPNITVNADNPKDFEKYLRICPSHVFRIDGNKLVVSNPNDCNLCMQCVEKIKSDRIKVEVVENNFIFSVESISGMPAEDIIENAADILEEKANELEKEVGRLK